MTVMHEANVIRGLLVAGCLVLGACSNATIFLTHQPMHPDTDQSVTFKVVSTGSVDRIAIAVERYTLTTATNGTHVQTVADPMTTVKTCDPPGNVANLTCSHTVTGGFPANSLIRLRAEALGGNGKTRSETYDFAAGTYPWPNDPIPIRVTGETVNHMDIVFIPDTDITLATFRNQLDDVVENLYFKYDTYKGTDTIHWRTLYNFYYSQQYGNYEESCAFTNPSNMANLQVIADTVAFLHQTTLRDCRSGIRMSSEINYDKTLIHESGHALFDLKDEYCCDSSYSQQACVPNLWSSLANCQADAPNLGYAASDCVRLTSATQTLNFWRVDPTGTSGCMMGPSQHNAGSDYLSADRRRINWRFGKCMGGECFPTPACP